MKDDQDRIFNKLFNFFVFGMMLELGEEKEVEKVVIKFIEQVVVKVYKNCLFFFFEFKFFGSLSEGIKCGLFNEFDFLCIMGELLKVFLDFVVDLSFLMFG